MIYLPKSQPAPPCLAIERGKASGNYNCGNVLITLQTDFKNKCYICEDREPHSINTEHFKPHKNKNLDLKFDWNNLFYCCAHCNNVKLAKEDYDDILNCIVEDDRVETMIKYELDPFPREKVKITAIVDNIKVNNTVQLLHAVYNGTTPLKDLEAANLRRKMLAEIRTFQNLLFEYDDPDYDENEKLNFKNQIIRQLRPTSNFTAFKRWIIRKSATFEPEFRAYL